jgi:Bardet-Biedl syndrome 2 protein
MYCRLLEPSNNSLPTGSVSFLVKERAARIALWLNQNFLVGDELEAGDGCIDVSFASLRHRQEELYIRVNAEGQVQLQCDNMDLCGDIIQNLAEYLALDDLSSVCHFPNEIDKMETMMQMIEELQTVRQRLSAEMADQSGIIRTLVVRAEDSRLVNDMCVYVLCNTVRYVLTSHYFLGKP